MNYCIESEREDDGRWLAEVSGLAGQLRHLETLFFQQHDSKKLPDNLHRDTLAVRVALERSQ